MQTPGHLWLKMKLIQRIDDLETDKIDKTSISNDFPMTDDTSMVISEAAALRGDLATRRKAYVSGVLKNDCFIYSSKAMTIGGVATFYITDDGTSTGNAVFTNVYPDSVSVVAYGSTANYQVFNPVVAEDNKSIAVNLDQATTVLFGTIQLVAASDGIDCRMYVMGD